MKSFKYLCPGSHVSIGQEMIPILHKFFGEYDPFISYHSFKIAADIIRYNCGNKNENLSFFKKTLEYLKITHGIRHPLYAIASEFHTKI